MITRWLAALLFLLALSTSAAPYSLVRFEPNRGQAGPSTRFLARAGGSLVLVGDTGVSLRHASGSGPDWHVQLEWEGARAAAQWQTLEPQPGTTSYLIGNQPEKWIEGVPRFGRIVHENIYDGIDLILYGAEDRLEYDFAIRAGGDPGQIRMRFRGAVHLAIGAGGDLIVALPSGRLIQKKPDLYQTGLDGSRRRVAGRYRLLGRDRAAFVVGSHDPARPLTIDPLLVSATLLGGTGDDRVIAADPRSVIVGTTTSADFPGVEAARHRGTDIFIHDPTTQSTTIIGGSGDDVATCAKIFPGPSGGLVIGGHTNSPDFPVTTPQNPGLAGLYAPQSRYGGGDWDGFLLTLYPSTNNSRPGFATYLGGSGDDRVLGIEASSISFGLVATVGSTTSTDFPVVNAWQPAASGGVDGFMTLTQLSTSGQVTFSTYLGGSGDDRALAISASAAWRDLYIGGVTGSSDWQTPGTWTGARNGPSDGFLLHIPDVNSLTGPPAQSAQGLFFGGSGDDQIAALKVMPNGSVGLAGMTSSPDLPVPNAAQPTYGGGSSDAFVAQFSADLQTLQYATFWGGSGAEESLAIAANGFDELLVGGWTNSSDFPVNGDSIAPCGRGADDGFLVHLDSTGQPIYATCYGGSGSDRITSVASDGGPYDFAGGLSDSQDLPLQDAVQTANAGSIDGFYAVLAVPVIHAEGLTVGKDLRGSGFAVLGDPNNNVGTPFTVSSSDPTRVLIAARPDDAGQATVTVANGAAGAPATRNFLVYCLVDSGTVAVALSAPGYASLNINVRCVPSGLYVNPPSVTAQSGNGTLSVLPAAFDPITGQILALQNPRGGLDPIIISVVNPSPDFVTFRPPSITIDPFANLANPSSYPYPTAFSFQTTGTGSTDVTFTTSAPFSFVPSNSAHVRAAGPALSLYVPTGARDVVAQMSLGFASSSIPPAPVPVTLTSSDPSKVRITTDPSLSGQSSVTVSLGGPLNPVGAWIEVLDTGGSVSITASAPGFDPVTTPVVFGELVVGWFDQYARPLPPTDLLPGQSTDAYLRAFVSPIIPYLGYVDYRYFLRAGTAPLKVEIENTASSVASAGTTGPLFLVNSGGPMWGAFPLTIRGLSYGTAAFSIKVTSGDARSAGPLNINVPAPALSINPVTVGYNLMVPTTVTIAGRSGSDAVNVTLTVSDPGKALLSLDPQTLGRPSLAVPMLYQSTAIYVQSLAGSGSVDITASADSYATGKTTVSLVPSGFAWVTPAATPFAPYAQDPKVAPYALDPANLAAFASQSVRPGLTGAVTLQISDATVANLSANALPLAAFGNSQSVKITSAGGGDAQIGIAQPPGFVQPTGRGPLRLKVPRPSIAFGPVTITRNTQVTLPFSLSSPASSIKPDVTFTSGDPSKLLLSTNRFNLGGPSATVSYQGTSANGSYAPVYLNALDGPVDVKLSASAPGLVDSSLIVAMGDTPIALIGGSGSTAATTNLQQDPLQLGISTANGLTLRPGLDPIPVAINSSNGDVATVPTYPILNSLTNSAPFWLKLLSAGETDLTLVPPAGFVAALPNAGRTLHVTVRSPSFVIPDFVLGRDLEAAVTMSVQNGTYNVPSDVDATLTSSDPSKVLLSADPAMPGVAVLKVHFVGGSGTTRTVYVQALDQSGQVSIAIAASGYSTTTTKVALAPTTFVPDQTSLTARLTSGSALLRFYPVPFVTPASYYSNRLQFRPGVPSFSVMAASSDSNVATVSPTTVAWPVASQELDVTVRPVATGSAAVMLTVPDPYIAPAPVPITVMGGNLSISASSLSVGKNLETQMGIYGDGFQNSVRVTVRSTDPSRVLVSGSPSAAGQASVDLVSQPGQQLVAYVQALSDSGSVNLVVSAAGYLDATTTVQLSPSAVILSGQQQNRTLTPLSAPLSFQANLALLNGSTSYSPTVQALRPGAPPVTVQASLSDPAIGAITPAQFRFNPGDTSKAFSVQPQSVGSALLSLSVPDGFTDPVGLRHQLITVVPAGVGFSAPLSVAKDLVRPNSLLLPAPAGQTMSITLTSSDPSRLLLSRSSSAAAAASVAVTVPAGGTNSETFYLVGLSSSGTVTLSATAPSLPSSTSTVTLAPSGFVFGQIPTNVSAGTPFSLPLQISALNPQTLAPEGSFALRPGLAPLSVSVTSSNTAVLSGPAVVFFYAGDITDFASLFPSSAGVSTLSIQTPPGFTAPSTGATTVLTVH